MNRDKIDKMSDGVKAKRKRRNAENYLNRYKEASLAKDVSRALVSSDFRSPGEFLAQVMRGNDPRSNSSPVIDLILKVRARGLDETPTLEEWLELVEYISDNEKYYKELIPIDHSIKAAEKLASILYAQKSKTETNSVISVKPLSKKEMKKYNEQFESSF